MSNDLNYKDWDRLCRKLAWTFMKRVTARGGRITYEDAYSEVQLCWVLARDGFKPELGFQFSTYFTRAVINGVGRYMASQHDTLGDQSLDAEWHAGDDDGSLGHDLVADPNARSPEQIAISRTGSDQIAIRTPLLKRMLELTESPSEDMRAELAAVAAQRSYAQEHGWTVSETHLPRDLTPAVLSRIFGFNWKHRLRLKQEMKEALRYVS